MRISHWILAAGFLAAVVLVGSKLTRGEPEQGQDTEGLTVQLCDGETTVAIGEAPKTAVAGQRIATELMATWAEKNPGRSWAMGEAPGAAEDDDGRVPDEIIEKRHTIIPPFDNTYLLGEEGQSEGHAYGQWSRRDLMIWERETKKMVIEGARIFHDGNLLGSTIAVSCDMCHPDGSNTHPETYPKYQTQLGKVVLLRDMINWCLEHPVRAKPLAADDPKMRALEAYMYAQRKGTPLSYGKH